MQIIRPVRVERTYTQKIDAHPAEVFPLLCPVKEVEWAQGWDPSAVYSFSGVAEPDCVFVTSEQPGESLWVITRHDAESCQLEFVKLTPGLTVGKISISLSDNETGGTDARVTYMHTALSEKGEQFVRDFTEEFYTEFMRQWETELNDYLRAKRLR